MSDVGKFDSMIEFYFFPTKYFAPMKTWRNAHNLE